MFMRRFTPVKLNIVLPPEEDSKSRRQKLGKKLVRESIWMDQGGRCFWCHRRTILPKRKLSNRERRHEQKLRHLATLDHLIPQSAGGRTYRDNLVVACLECNAARQDRTSQCFLKWLKSLAAVSFARRPA